MKIIRVIVCILCSKSCPKFYKIKNRWFYINRKDDYIVITNIDFDGGVFI